VSFRTRIVACLRLDPPEHRGLERGLRPLQRGPVVVGGEEGRLRGIEQIAGYGVVSLVGAAILAIFGHLTGAGVAAAVGIGALALALFLRRQQPPV
jgi:hypothetical protein